MSRPLIADRFRFAAAVLIFAAYVGVGLAVTALILRA